MNFKFLSKAFVLALFLNQVSAGPVYIDPPTDEGKPLAIVWIHGMSCKPEAYETIAKELQDVSAQSGYKTWVGIPEFIFDAPEPILIEKYVTDTIKELKKRGFKGDDIFIASHSLGGVMSQIFVKDHSDLIKGQILMGSTLTRDRHSLTKDGTTLFDYKTPTL